MNKIKKIYKEKFLPELIKYWNIRLIRIYFLMLISFLISFLIDWLSKDSLFDYDFSNAGFINDNFQGGLSNNDYNLKLFGFKSLPNFGTTIFNFLNITMPQWAYHFITFLLIFMLVVATFFVKNNFRAIAIGMIVAGIFGNGLDRIVHVFSGKGYVRDVIYIPWADKGVFNFADVFVIFGSFFVGLSFVIEIYKKDKKSKKKTDISLQNEPEN